MATGCSATVRFVPATQALAALSAGGYPGFRHANTGVLTNVGNEGSVWSGSASGTNGFYLNFKSTNLNPGNATNRANGLQVRCLQAFIRTPLFSLPLALRNGAMGSGVAHAPRGCARVYDKFSGPLVPYADEVWQ